MHIVKVYKQLVGQHAIFEKDYQMWNKGPYYSMWFPFCSLMFPPCSYEINKW
jgi:hypothetical protein